MPKVVYLHSQVFNKYKLNEIWGLVQVTIVTSATLIKEGQTHRLKKKPKGKEN